MYKWYTWQAFDRVMKVTSVSKFRDWWTPNTDFQCTHVRCPWACFAGCSYRRHICFAGFTVHAQIVMQPFGKWVTNIWVQLIPFPSLSPDVFVDCLMMKNQGEELPANRKTQTANCANCPQGLGIFKTSCIPFPRSAAAMSVNWKSKTQQICVFTIRGSSSNYPLSNHTTSNQTSTVRRSAP